jgi:putative ABC transport system permease protein
VSRLPSLALRNVGRNRRRSLITGLTILFGVAMVINVRGFMWGLQSVMIADTVEARLGALQIHRKGYVDSLDSLPLSLNLPDGDAFRARIRAVPHVLGVSARILFNGLVSNGRSQTMFVGRGLDVEHEEEACPKSARSVAPGGRTLAPGDGTSGLLGSELAESFGVKPGQSVAVQTVSPGGRANSLDLSIQGLTTSAFPFENKRVVTVPLRTAQELMGLAGRVTEYAVRIDDLDRIDEVADALRAALGSEYEVHTWRELQPFLRDVINRQNFVLGSISSVMLVVVLTGIVNTMLMSVFERVREIGTMLALGIRRRQVLQLFLLEATIIGVSGGVAGALLGRAIVAAIAAIGVPLHVSGLIAVDVLHPTVTPRFVALAVAVAIAAATLAALWPAWRASRMNPVDALRS